MGSGAGLQCKSMNALDENHSHPVELVHVIQSEIKKTWEQIWAYLYGRRPVVKVGAGSGAGLQGNSMIYCMSALSAPAISHSRALCIS